MTIQRNNTVSKVREPLFHVSKRDDIPKWASILINIGSIAIALLLSGIFLSSASPKGTFIGFYKSMLYGTFGESDYIWELLRDTALLLGVGLALAPAFKMKFWNLGGNGQILMGALATTACMYYLGGVVNDYVVYPIMIIAGVLGGALWAFIPAFFKAKFNTNESLFTLMMNYIAIYLVKYVVLLWFPRGSGSMGVLPYANLPQIGNKYLLTILVVAVLTVLMFVYFRFSKHGYEISVVGESQNTAKYVGINVKKVIIRTLILSGAICGLVGALLSGAINYGSVSADTPKNRGFTAIIVAWLANFDPIVMIITAFFVTFLSKGITQVRTDFGFYDNALIDVVVAIVYFFVIGCDFFIRYKLTFKTAKKEKK